MNKSFTYNTQYSFPVEVAPYWAYEAHTARLARTELPMGVVQDEDFPFVTFRKVA